VLDVALECINLTAMAFMFPFMHLCSQEMVF
jgi:hypothetical protein